MKLSTDHWTTLIDAIGCGAVRHLCFNGIDFSTVDSNAFLVAVGCRGLERLSVKESVLPCAFVTDDLLRASVAKGLSVLCCFDNNSDAPQRLSEDAVLDFFFRADAVPRGNDPHLALDGYAVTEMFFTKLIEVRTVTVLGLS